MKNQNILLIIRHVSGSGSSSLAEFLVSNVHSAVNHEADSWMMEGDNYVFKPERLGYCHKQCLDNTELSLKLDQKLVIVNNTFTDEKSLKPYQDLAAKYNYKFVSVILENRANSKNIHGVDEQTLGRQEGKLRNSIKLR